MVTDAGRDSVTDERPIRALDNSLRDLNQPCYTCVNFESRISLELSKFYIDLIEKKRVLRVLNLKVVTKLFRLIVS